MNFTELRKNLMITYNTLEVMSLNSRNLSIIKSKIEESAMLAGKLLELSGQGENPYAEKDGTRISVEDIIPTHKNTFDVYDRAIMDKGHIYVIDEMREYLQREISGLMNKETLSMLDSDDEEVEFIAMSIVLGLHKNLLTARMWLGKELGRIRNESK